MQPLNLFSYPKAILHVDGDCFFASCEIARNPALRGKPVVTGVERGIVSSLSYEAKARGVKRAMRLSEVKKICPETVFLPSDYETYSLYSMRMFHIVRRYTSHVEEYSIDECFADLTGLRRPLNMSYEIMAQKIKKDLDKELGMTFSAGLAPTKVLAKVASKWKKPSGFTPIPGRNIHKYLEKLSLEDVWGIGPQTTAYLNKLGLKTALEFAQKDKAWVLQKMTKPHYEIWQELRGKLVYDLNTEEKHDYQSISKTKTFTPASKDPEYVCSQLSKNVENACIKARRHGLVAKKFFFFLKSQDYRFYGAELKLNRASNLPTEMLLLIRHCFYQVFDPNIEYRSTGIILQGLQHDNSVQMNLFSDPIKIEKLSKTFSVFDELSSRYGKHALFLGSSFKAMTMSHHQGARKMAPARSKSLFKGEGARRRLGVPMLGSVM